MKMTNDLGLPQPLVDAVSNDIYDGPDINDPTIISVTGLLSPPQQRKILANHYEFMTEDISDRIWALMGKAIHQILENANNTGIAEKRLEAPLGEFYLSGAFDRMALIERADSWVLQDYKMASVWEYVLGARPEREQQLNLLRWLAEQNGYKVDRIENVFIYRDWSLTKAKRDKEYPQRQVHILPQNIWDDEETMRFMLERLAHHMEEDPLCSDEERWKTADTYAVHTKGRKSAHRLLETEDEAHAWARKNLAGKSFEVVKREGVAKRCENYCAASMFCLQWAGDQSNPSP